MSAAVTESEPDLQVQVVGIGGGALPTADEISRWAAAALERAGLEPSPRLTVRFVDDAESSDLNLAWRNKSGPTNVLAFQGPEAGTVPDSERELGDLAICVPQVRREAQAQGKTFVGHLAHLVVHGTLHLAGYTHDGKRDAARMERLETAIMRDLGYPDPYLAS